MRLILVALLAALNLSTPALADAPAPAETAEATAETAREVEITVSGGYQPARIEAAPGERLRLRFTRHEYSGCTREVVFPSLGLRRELPPHETVVIEVTAPASGQLDFECGMGMSRGAVVVSGG